MNRASVVVAVAASLFCAVSFTSGSTRADEAPATPSSDAPAPLPAPPLPEPSPESPAPAPAPAPTSPESPAPVPPPPAPPQSKPRTVVAATVELGGAARRLFDLNLTGFELAAGIDISREHGAAAGLVRASYGRSTSTYGLPVHVARLEGGGAAILADRFRLGATAGLGFIDVERATAGQLNKFGFALGGLASADLVQSESFAVYVALDGTLDFYPHLQRTWSIGGVLASAALRLGARF